METLYGSIYICALVLLFALLIERLQELIKSILDYFDSRFDWYRLWSWQAHRLAKRLEGRLKMNSRENIKFYAFVIERASGILATGQAPKTTGVPMIMGDTVRAFYMKMILKIIGIGLGLAVACGLRLDIVTNWNNITTASSYETTWYGLLITGIAIGLGSAPVHKLITGLERIEKTKRTKQEASS